ncbi:MAG: peptide deformylase [Coriobacteriia bacterium]|nr:peptide deformylase [Coriobacteriia bacterium]
MNVIIYPGPALKQRAAEVDPSTDPSLPELAAQMARVMYDAPGIGLAATQIGVIKRVVVYDLGDESPRPVALCNPVITSTGDQTEVDDEGCLSFPGISVPVERYLSVTCEAVSLAGEPVTIQAEGLHARLLQHEIDHLDGVVIIDRAAPEERKAALRRFREALEAGATPGQTDIESSGDRPVAG